MTQGGGKCRLGLMEMLDSLSPKEKQIAQFIIDYPEEVVEMSIEQLAKVCRTSVSSVVRLCKNCGYSGFKELCRMLSGDLAAASSVISYQDIRPGDSPASVFRNICLSNMKAIENTLMMAEDAAIDQAVKLLCQAGRIDFYGMGTSALVALDAHNKFLRTGKMVMANADFHVQLLTATSLKKGDVAVLISYSGETYDIVTLADQIRHTGCSIITITSYGKNSLSEYADVKLHSLSTETYIRSGAMSSRIAQMTVIDALYSAVCSSMYHEVKPFLDKTRLAVSKARPK